MTNQFGMGPMGMGSLSGMLESVELLKKAWSGFSLPASFAPTMDLDELDKRIADLKTVEQWLTMNLTLLRGTVQGMEIQRGTVAALKAFGSSMGSEDLARGAFAAAAQAAASAAASATGASSTSASAPDPGSTAGDGKGQPTGQAGADASDPSAAAAELTRAAAAAVNPATWWNLLQTQFAQVAQGATATASGETAAPTASATTPAAPAAASAKKAAPRKARAGGAAKTAAAPRSPKMPTQPAAEAPPPTGARARPRR